MKSVKGYVIDCVGGNIDITVIHRDTLVKLFRFIINNVYKLPLNLDLIFDPNYTDISSHMDPSNNLVYFENSKDAIKIISKGIKFILAYEINYGLRI